MNAYGTHLPVLKKLFETADIKTVLEFGPGEYSTDLFVESATTVISIDQQNHAYADMIRKKYKDNKHIEVLYLAGSTRGLDYLKNASGKFDLIFVDGHIDGRWGAVNQAFSKARIIVAHDTESKRYDWKKIVVPKGWHTHVFTDRTPWTTLWTKDRKLINSMKSKK